MTSTATLDRSSTGASNTTQVYRIFIKATPQAIWDAITKPEWTQRFGYGLRDEYDLRPGGKYRGHANQGMIDMGMGGVIVDGEVIEVDPPRKLVQTWRMLMDPTAAAEGFSRLTYEIEGPGADGVCRLTVTHELGGMPSLFAMTSGDNEFGAMGGGGWPWILSDLKTLLETGEAFPKG